MAKTATLVSIKSGITINRTPAPPKLKRAYPTKWPYREMRVGDWIEVPASSKHDSYAYALAKAWSYNTGNQFRAYKSDLNKYTITRIA